MIVDVTLDRLELVLELNHFVLGVLGQDQVGLSYLQVDLTLKHQSFLLRPEPTYLRVQGIYFLQIKKSLVGALFHLNNLDLLECLLIDLQALQLGIDFSESSAQGLSLIIGLCEGCLHLCHLVVELYRAAHLLQDGEETIFALDDQILHLTLLDDLELCIALE